MEVNSWKGAKKYFLPVYFFWAVTTPTILTIIQAWLFKSEDQSIIEAILWQRLPSYYALFGVIWPLTIVVAPAFYISFRDETGYTFIESLSHLDTTEGLQMFISSIAFFVAWILPVITTGITVFLHKRSLNPYYVNEEKENEELTWIDYIAGFI